MKRRTALAFSAVAALLAAGCTSLPPQAIRDERHWTGRLSLRVDSEPIQNLSALFDLHGSAEHGELTLSTPLGTTLAVLRWSPGEAQLLNNGQTRSFDSMEALAQAATGAAIPIEALFDWLDGRASPIAGWTAHLDQIADGRLHATREAPEPTAELRIVFSAEPTP